MKKIFYTFLLCLTHLVSAQKDRDDSGILNYLQQDICSFLNPKASEISPEDFLLDLLVVGSGCIFADKTFNGTTISSNIGSAFFVALFAACNEYFRCKYGEIKPTLTKNILYLSLYLAYKNKVFIR